MDLIQFIDYECLKVCQKEKDQSKQLDKCIVNCRKNFFISIGRFPRYSNTNEEFKKYQFSNFHYGYDSEEVTQQHFREQDKFKK